jgi:hypothetical protein
MKKINSRITRGSGGLVSKYVKLMLVGFLFKKLKTKNLALPHLKTKVETIGEQLEPAEKTESNQKAKGSSIMKIGKIVMGALAGVTLIYAVKKVAAKNGWHRAQAQ